MKKILIVAVLTVVLATLIMSCSSSNTSTTTTSSTTSSTTTSSTTTSSSSSTTSTSSGATFQSVAAAGQTVYSANCATCHGATGAGGAAIPALWGSSAALAKYNTAQGLLSFIAASMPLSSPGSLSHQDYLNVLAYILVQDNEVAGSTAFVESGLSGITLK